MGTHLFEECPLECPRNKYVIERAFVNAAIATLLVRKANTSNLNRTASGTSVVPVG